MAGTWTSGVATTCIVSYPLSSHSPPEQYEGGELIVKTSKKEQSVPLTQGKMILFPSFILHKVTPVTKGERYMLVGWLRGETPFQ